MTMKEPEDRRERFERLYHREYLSVLRFVARRCQGCSAEDLVHEAFMIAWQKDEQIPRDSEGARAWLFTVARNVLLNDGRARARAAELSVQLDPAESVGASPEEHWVTRIAVAEAFNRLEPSHQEALSLAVFEGLSSRDAARVLGITPIAYRVRLSRARKRLDQLMTVQTTTQTTTSRTSPLMPPTAQEAHR